MQRGVCSALCTSGVHRKVAAKFPTLSDIFRTPCFTVFVKAARLQSEFCTKDFFRATSFLTKNAPKLSPKSLSLCSVGQKKSRKSPSKLPTNFSKFPCEKSKKIHRRASAGAQGEVFDVQDVRNTISDNFRVLPKIFSKSRTS